MIAQTSKEWHSDAMELQISELPSNVDAPLQLCESAACGVSDASVFVCGGRTGDSEENSLWVGELRTGSTLSKGDADPGVCQASSFLALLLARGAVILDSMVQVPGSLGQIYNRAVQHLPRDVSILYHTMRKATASSFLGVTV
jgi:hypothetical protein